MFKEMFAEDWIMILILFVTGSLILLKNLVHMKLLVKYNRETHYNTEILCFLVVTSMLLLF